MKGDVEIILTDELNLKDFPQMAPQMRRDGVRTVLNKYTGFFMKTKPSRSQHPLVRDIMRLLEKSGNGLIQKSELKEALRELIKKNTGKNQINKKSHGLRKIRLAKTRKSKRPALRSSSDSSETVQQHVFKDCLFKFLQYMVLILFPLSWFFLEKTETTTKVVSPTLETVVSPLLSKR